MQQRERWRSRSGKGLGLLEVTIRKGFFWNRLWDIQKRATGLLCSLKSLCMERLDIGVYNGAGSQGSS